MQGTDGAGRRYVAFYADGFGVVLLDLGHQAEDLPALTKVPEGVQWRATELA